jgi:hypothetical protein
MIEIPFVVYGIVIAFALGLVLGYIGGLGHGKRIH